MAGEDIRAGGAYLEITGQDTGLQKALDRASKRLESFGKSAQGWSLKTAALIGGAFVGIKSAVSGAMDMLVGYGDMFDKMALRTGVSTEALSQFKHTAEICGSTIQEFEASLKLLEKNLGSGGATKYLDELGLTLQDVAKLTPDEQFIKIGVAIGKLDDPAKRADLALALLGRTGTKMLPMLRQGEDGIRSIMAEADKLGLTISGETAAAAATLGDSFTKLKGAMFGAGSIIAQAVTPALTAFVNGVTNTITKIMEFYKSNEDLQYILSTCGAAIDTVNGALGTLWEVVLPKVVAGFSAVLKVISWAVDSLQDLSDKYLGTNFAESQAAKEAQKAAEEAARKQEEEERKKQAAYEETISTLNTLAEIESNLYKTEAQKSQAVALVEKLNAAYEGLGLTVDEATGAINGLDAAAEKIAGPGKLEISNSKKGPAAGTNADQFLEDFNRRNESAIDKRVNDIRAKETGLESARRTELQTAGYGENEINSILDSEFGEARKAAETLIAEEQGKYKAELAQKAAEASLSAPELEEIEYSGKRNELQQGATEALKSGNYAEYQNFSEQLAKLEEDWYNRQREIAEADLATKQTAVDEAQKLLQSATEGGIEEEIVKAKEALKEAYTGLEEAQNKSGQLTEEDAQRAQEAQQAALSAAEEERRRQEEEIKAAMESNKTELKSTGTFNALEATAQAESNGLEDINKKQLDVMKKSDQYLRRIYDTVEELSDSDLVATFA